MYDNSFMKKLSDFVDKEIEHHRQGTHDTHLTHDQYRQVVVEALAEKMAAVNAQK